MNMLKLTAAAALVAASLSASAMSSITDEDLSALVAWMRSLPPLE